MTMKGGGHLHLAPVCHVRPSTSATLPLQLLDYREALAIVSTEATQEAALEALLDKLQVLAGWVVEWVVGGNGDGGLPGVGQACSGSHIPASSLSACLSPSPPLLQDKWRHIEFSVNPYKELKDTYILGGVDEVMIVLEDSMVMMTTILSSRYVAGIR